MHVVHLVVRFAVEVAALVAFGLFGARSADGAVGVALAVALPALMAVFWGLFVAPRSFVHTPPRIKEGLALLVFMVAAVALARAGEPLLGLVLAVVAALNSVQLRVAGLRG